ncbi:hypothetical protein M2152_002393 [Microbacteriaceae bacterium SG_E_30_P1]|uniref:Uncharacterized protein n=1 Tax=Antiquaquibacter oligotrophicus TaxID=2880260 RepID=A0ABT6KQE7_9MICO|nr:hypothetical protein [Antiquaquibacter oligotrophicus]MDH6182211.1 hypothetical protein [Antiquaquibacter oligotrophicus]UDF12129.1 hypothetical protein LH407_08095 [Antiquaquibacter oligotrophicus]
MTARHTPQTLDPLGGLTARYFAVVSTVVSVGIVILLLASNGDQIRSLPLQAAAIALFVGAAGINLLGVDPRNFPFGAWRHAALHVLMIAAFAADCASRFPGAVGVWAAVALTVLLLLIGSFRPAIEIAGFTVVSSVAVGAIALLFSATAELALGYAIPLLAVGCGAAAFSHVLVSRVLEWRGASILTFERERDTIRATEEAEATERRRQIVDYRVGPYLENILDTDAITPADIARARGLATTLRTMLVRSAQASWLAELVDELDDPDGLLETLNADQRRAIGAGISEVRQAAPVVPGSIRAQLRAGPPATLRVTAVLTDGTGKGLRPAAYRAVLRQAFRKVSLSADDRHVEVLVELS